MSEKRPRQLVKRDALIEAAARVLLREGLAGCSVRAVAEASPLTKSALHYYFEDFEELLDLAFRRAMDEFFARVEVAAEAESDPVNALWAAARTYLQLGADRPGRAPLLGFEVQIQSTRRGQLDSVREVADRNLAFFTRLLRRTGLSEPEQRASVFLATLLGALVRNSAHALDLEIFLAEAALAMGLPRPPTP